MDAGTRCSTGRADLGNDLAPLAQNLFLRGFQPRQQHEIVIDFIDAPRDAARQFRPLRALLAELMV